MVNSKKVEIVKEIEDKISKANLILLTDYQGLKVGDLEDLKTQIEKNGAEYKVVKNTLLKRAGDKLMDGGFFDNLSGPTGVLFCYQDEVAPIKNFLAYKKDLGDLLKIKFGLLGKNLLGEKQVLALAKLPGKETLIMQFMGGLNSPLIKLTNVLSWSLNSFALTINQIKEKKEYQKN